MEKKQLIVQQVAINFDLPQSDLPDNVFTRAINFTPVNTKFVATKMSSPAPVGSEKGPWAPLPGLGTLYNVSLLYHFDSYPFIESTGALITVADSTNADQLTSSGQTFGAGAFKVSNGSGLSGGWLDIAFTSLDPDHTIGSAFTVRFRYTPTVNTGGGVTNVLEVDTAIQCLNYSNTSLSVFRGMSAPAVVMTPGISYAISIEVMANTGYLYVDGSLVHTFVDLATNCPYTFSDPAHFIIGHTTNDVIVAPTIDEFMFINNVALANGAASYVVETTPFGSVIYV